MSSRLDVSKVPPQGGYIAKQCPVVIQNRVLVPELEMEPKPEVRLRMDAGVEFEAETLKSIRFEEPANWIVIPQQPAQVARQLTLEALESGVAVIESGFLPVDIEGRRTGRPDLLVRADGGYVPVDVKHHRTLDEEDDSSVLASESGDPFYESARRLDGYRLRKHEGDALQLAHYHRMLQASGHGATEPFGGILGKEGVIVWYDLAARIWTTPAKSDGKKRKKRSSLERYDFEFGFRLDIAAAALMHRDDASVNLIVEPRSCGECGDCGFFGYCQPTLAAGSGDTSLLPGLTYQQWRHLRDLGIRQRSQVAELHYPTASLIKDGVDIDAFRSLAEATGPHASLESLRPRARRQLKTLSRANLHTTGDLLGATDPDTTRVGGFIASRILDARAALGPEPVYRRPGATGREVPRADIEIDLDMENVNEGVYLWGALHRDRTAGAAPEYIPFVTWEPLDDEEELRVFISMWEWLAARRAEADDRALTVKIYVWHEPAETSHLRRITKSADTQLHGEVNALVESDSWVDLKSVFHASWITGGSASLKVIAPLSGFEWQVDDADGGYSMVKYAEATEPDASESRAPRDWLLDYNRGDVEATSAIREWLSTAGATWPTVDTV